LITPMRAEWDARSISIRCEASQNLHQQGHVVVEQFAELCEGPDYGKEWRLSEPGRGSQRFLLRII
jgi:hypothetical protein